MGAWIALLPGIVGIFLLWVCGGMCLLLAAGVREARTLFAAPLVACATIGLLTLVSPPFTWSLLFVLAGLVVACLVVFAIRALVDRMTLRSSLQRQKSCLAASARSIRSSKLIGLLVGMAVNAVLMFVLVATSVGSPDYFMQNYDSPFHLSVVRHIAETGSASPIGAGSIMGTGSTVYPSLWHAHVVLVMGSLTGQGIVAGSWTVVLTLLMFALPLSTCALVNRLFAGCSGCTLALAAVVPSLFPGSVTGFLTFGPLLANIGGIVFLPLALALVMSSFSGTCDARGVARRVASLVVCLLGLGLFQPNAVFTLTLFLLPFFVSIARRKLTRAGLVALFAACWAALFASSMFAQTINCLDRLPADVEKGEYYFGKLGLDYAALASVDFMVVGISILIVGLFVFAAVKLHARWRHSWYLVGLGLIVAQLFASLFPTNWFSIIATGFWYRDCFRFSMVLRFFACAAVLIVPELLMRFVGARAGHGSHMRMASRAAVVLVVGVALVFVSAYGWRDYRHALYESSAGAWSLNTPDALNDVRSAFCQRVAAETGEAAVLNNGNDAGVWLYPLYGAHALVKGRPANQVGAMSDDLSTVIAQIDRYGAQGADGEAVRRAAAALGLEYVVQMSEIENTILSFDEDGTKRYKPSDATNRIDASTPGFALVFEQDDMRLYRLEPSSVAGV